MNLQFRISHQANLRTISIGAMRGAVISMALLMTTACDQRNPDPGQQPGREVWTENVKLSSGKILKVERENRYGQGELGSSGGPQTYSRIEFDYKGKRYKWESVQITPALIEIDQDDRPVIAGGVGYEWAWRQLGSPCDKVYVLVANGDEWVRIPSWEMTVSNRLNIAADKSQADEGLAMADDVKSPSRVLKNSYYKDKCKKEESGNDK